MPTLLKKTTTSSEETAVIQNGARSVVLLNSNEQVPISSETDMMVPVSFVMMKHDYSKIQIRAIINIIKKLQVDLKKLFSMGSRRAIINSGDWCSTTVTAWRSVPESTTSCSR